jgi:chloramphenicol 3-O phosphotransferase
MIIILNGCSSSGKTSLVKVIQDLSDEFWLTFGIDDVLDAMPDKYWGEGEKSAEGFQFVSSADKEGFPITEVKVGPIGEKVAALAPKIVKQLADSGFNVIVDEVIWERKDLEDYALSLKKHQVCFVNVYCELSVMEEREKKRGDRQLGMSRWQFTKMKDLDWNYDMKVDTTATLPDKNAKIILKFIVENPSSTAFLRKQSN